MSDSRTHRRLFVNLAAVALALLLSAGHFALTWTTWDYAFAAGFQTNPSIWTSFMGALFWVLLIPFGYLGCLGGLADSQESGNWMAIGFAAANSLFWGCLIAFAIRAIVIRRQG